MKRAVVFAVLMLSVGVFMASYRQQDNISAPVVAGAQTAKDSTVTVNTGETANTYRGIVASTPLAALMGTAKRENIQVVTKTYSFGTMVESIAGLKNSKDKAWIFFVNGKSGVQAPDKQRINPGDVVEWRYMTPLY